MNNGQGLVLMENKLVEHSFYNCSALRTWGSEKKPGNPDPTRCSQVAEILRDPRAQCHQLAWGRKYWEILLPAADRDALLRLRSCPAANGGYQLFRQQALAEGIARSGKYDFVVSCVALDARNDAIRRCLRGIGLEDVRHDWVKLFSGKAEFKTFTHQQWVAWVRDHDDSGLWKDWSEYVAARYAY